MSASVALASGTQIGDYEVVEPLRSGGMATLFLARKSGAAGFSRYVAIKVVHAELAADPQFVELFLDEARLSAQIAHPNVVHVEDLGERDGLYYLVMEYVHGCSLSDLMLQMAEDGRRPTPELACHIALKVCEGLHAAHEARDVRGEPLGIVHRDVSPQNILLSRAGDVKLIDFGIAKAAGTSGQGLVGAGKLAYMPPEQAAGERVDRRADIYAVGVLLWEMLTMQRLFHARTPEGLLDKVLHPDVVAPSERAEGLSPSLDALVLRALSPDRDARPPTAGELSRAIAEALPTAASLQPSQLSGLLDDLMAAPLESSERRLPSELTRSSPRPIQSRSGGTTALTIAVGARAAWTAEPTELPPERTATAPFEIAQDEPVPIEPPRLSETAMVVPAQRRGFPTWLAATLGALGALALASTGFYAWTYAPDDPGRAADPTPATVTAPPDVEPTPEPAPEPALAAPEPSPAALVGPDEARDEPVAEERPSPRARRGRRRRRAAPAPATADDNRQRRIDGVVIVSDYGDE